MCDDFDYDYDEDDYDEMDFIGGDISSDADNSLDTEDTPESGISFEEFLFWGGFLGINIDEERIEKSRKKKKKEISDSEDTINR